MRVSIHIHNMYICMYMCMFVLCDYQPFKNFLNFNK